MYLSGHLTYCLYDPSGILAGAPLVWSCPLTVNVTASEDDLRAVRLSACFAIFAAVAHILDGLIASSLARLELLDLVAHLDDDTGTLDSIRATACMISFLPYLVTGTLGAELGHLG